MEKLTPSVLVAKLRENQNNNKTLKSLFASQFLGKFSNEELDGLKKSIENEIERREEGVIAEHINFLLEKGFTVTK
jgi:hypothetical protein